MDDKKQTLQKFKKLFDNENENLKIILSYIKEESIFLKDEKRLLSIEEIINYKDEFNINIDQVIPLIDLYDNEILIYNIEKGQFQILDISDDFIRNVDDIQKYIDIIKGDK